MHSLEQKKGAAPKTPKPTLTVSAIVNRDVLIEMVYDPFDQRTEFAVFEKESWRTIDAITRTNGERLVPYSAANSLIKHNVVLFPSEPEEYGSTAELVADIRDYIHRYCDLSARFELLAAHYALFSWVHDRFAELPYLRLRGDFGTGKTRFLLTVGSICRTPIFASGASGDVLPLCGAS